MHAIGLWENWSGRGITLTSAHRRLGRGRLNQFLEITHDARLFPVPESSTGRVRGGEYLEVTERLAGE